MYRQRQLTSSAKQRGVWKKGERMRQSFKFVYSGLSTLGIAVVSRMRCMGCRCGSTVRLFNAGGMSVVCLRNCDRGCSRDDSHGADKGTPQWPTPMLRISPRAQDGGTVLVARPLTTADLELCTMAHGCVSCNTSYAILNRRVDAWRTMMRACYHC